MNRIKSLKSFVFVAIIPLLIALQPTITYACTVGAGSHCGG